MLPLPCSTWHGLGVNAHDFGDVRLKRSVYPHRYRYTYACHLLENGALLDFIQSMLGHEKVSTAHIYAQ
ncbi:tyrosine-type recombinase/integrase [Brevibacillus reuszeri]|uniref:tyrosine-type recombinase/integrase n=1 Tax=Brevibacillus reuszeri TaxID=54915 RepID=UPI0028A0B4D8|nr:tyrosine-type recombinase/integrase [Brevibacillus reuszeri]